MIELVRFPDWPQRLLAAVNARRAMPYAWGSNDCVLYAADMVAAITGIDLAEEFRGAYHDERGAAALMAREGWADLASLADAHLPRCLARPRRGDLVLLPGTRGDYLGIVAASGVVAAPDVDKPRLRPMTGLIAAWSVG